MSTTHKLHGSAEKLADQDPAKIKASLARLKESMKSIK